MCKEDNCVSGSAGHHTAHCGRRVDPFNALERVVVAQSRLLIAIASGDLPPEETPNGRTHGPQWKVMMAKDARNESLIQSIVLAHAWLHQLQEETFESVERVRRRESHPPEGRSTEPSTCMPLARRHFCHSARPPARVSLVGANSKAVVVEKEDHRSLLG
jgi:hypothetical protein